MGRGITLELAAVVVARDHGVVQDGHGTDRRSPSSAPRRASAIASAMYSS